MRGSKPSKTRKKERRLWRKEVMEEEIVKVRNEGKNEGRGDNMISITARIFGEK